MNIEKYNTRMFEDIKHIDEQLPTPNKSLKQLEKGTT